MASQTNAVTIPKTMKAWVLGGPDELSLVEKPVPEPGRAEVLVRIDAIAVCATDIEIIKHGLPAIIDGGSPFNKGFTPGHEYMGTVVKLGPTVDEFEIGDRITVEVHAGCGRCQRCREGMHTSCLNYGYREKGHRANGFSTDGGFAEYASTASTPWSMFPMTCWTRRRRWSSRREPPCTASTSWAASLPASLSSCSVPGRSA